MKGKYSTFHGLAFYFTGLSANGVNRLTKNIKRAREGDIPGPSSTNHEESRDLEKKAKTQKL